jgi:hypothetical protein
MWYMQTIFIHAKLLGTIADMVLHFVHLQLVFGSGRKIIFHT